MSLLESNYETFTIINKVIAGDGYGGTVATWTEGAKFEGAIVRDTSTQMRVALAMGVKSDYTLTVKRSISLDYHMVIRRESDAKIFRLTSGTNDNQTPVGAALDMRQYTAEEFILNSEILSNG